MTPLHGRVVLVCVLTLLSLPAIGADTLLLSVTIGKPVLLPRAKYPDLIEIDVSGARAGEVKKLNLRVLTGDVTLSSGGTPARTLAIARPTSETASVSMTTESAGSFAVEVTALDANDKELTDPSKDNAPLEEGKTYIVGTVSPGYRTTFMSHRVSSEFFVGATFANEYDADGKSTGFSESAPLARLSFDTLWHPGIAESSSYTGGTPAHGSRSRRSKFSGLLHTGLEMQFASFPFGTGAEAGEENLERDNAFSGSLYLLYQPDSARAFASYTATAQREDKPWDAVRWGVFVKPGFTTRTQIDTANRDDDVYRVSVGVRFSHHQTSAPRPIDEWENHTPMRFVEISYTRFQDWAGEPDADRLLVDAGMRVPGLGSEVIPFFAGIHANTGRGHDDLRVFAGFLFQLDELVRLFQGAKAQ
jgi:hypothetical protein